MNGNENDKVTYKKKMTIFPHGCGLTRWEEEHLARWEEEHDWRTENLFGGLRGSELFGWGAGDRGADLVCEPRKGRDEGGSRGGRGGREGVPRWRAEGS